MRAKLLEQLSPQHQLLVFFSSYLSDMFSLIKNIKSSVCQLIGIQPPEHKTHFISSDIHSVLLACNTGFEDLRRVQILLKGHVKGKMVAQAISQSVRSSRKITQNLSSSRLSRQSSKKHNYQPSNRFKGNPEQSNRYENKSQQKDQLRSENQIKNKQFIDGQYYQTSQNPQIRKINNSKSQGQLSPRKYKKSSSLLQNQQKTPKTPFGIIDKIRSQLQVAFNYK